MAGPKIAAELLLSTDFKDVVKEIDKGLSAALKKHSKEVEKTVGGAWRDAIQLALGEGKAGRVMRDFIQAGVVDAAETYKRMMKENRAEEAQAQSELLEKRAKAFKREVDLRRRAFQEMQDRQLETAEEAADRYKGGAEKMASILRGDFGGLLDVARGGGRGLASRGRAMQERAARIEQAGGDPKQVAQMAKIGGSLAKIGMALATVAAAVGAIVVLVKLFADLEAKIKDMNKALLEGAGAADFGFGAMEIRGGKVRQTLEKMREETTAMNENFMRFRVGAKEQQQILSQFNQAGLTFRKMNDQIEKGTSHMKSYSDVTALAITYSRNLGVSTSEIAQKMGEFTLETGMGLQDIAEQFSVITREAMVAGFATKRFYAAVVEVSSGMAFYGVRIDETAKLLKTFDSLLGETVGTEAFKRLVGQYKDKSAQDRIRDLIVKDQKFAQNLYSKAFEQQAATLARDFQMDPDEVRRLLNLDEVELTQALRGRGMGPEQIDRFINARIVQQAAGGDFGAMTRAAPFAGPGFDVAMAAQMGPVFGGKRIDEVLRGLSRGTAGAAELAALEQVSGKSLDELEKLGRLFTRAEADLRTMQDLAERMQRGDYVPNDEDMRTQKEIGDRLGLFVDEQGNIMRGMHDANGRLVKENAVAINDAMDVVTTQPTEGEEQLEKALTKDQEIATEISRNITGLSEIMEQTVLAVLNDIYNVLAGFFEAWSDKEGVEAQRLKAVEGARATRTSLEQEIEDLDQRMADLDTQIAAAKEAGNVALAKQLEADKTNLDKEKAIAGKQIQTMAKLEADLETADDAQRTVGKQLGALSKAGAVTMAPGAWSKGLDQAVTDVFGESEDPRAGLGGMALFGLESGRRVGDAFGEGAASVDSLMSYLRDNFESLNEDEKKALLDTIGGMDALNASFKAAEVAMGEAEQGWSELDNTFYLRRKRLGKAAFEAEVIRQTMAHSRGGAAADVPLTSAEIRARQSGFEEGSAGYMMLDAVATSLEAIEKSSAETASAAETGIAIDLVGAKKAKDLILPAAGGSPIITDERDTLFAARPGGPLAGAMGAGGGGGGRGTVQINIYGGDQRKIYDTVMRVMKATGNA